MDKWINVADRLPEECGYFIAYTSYDLPEIVILNYDTGEGDWEDSSATKQRPSHWMPLPDPPKDIM